MIKEKRMFLCQNCGSQSPKWQGKCYDCGSMNTFVEEIISTRSSASPAHDSATPLSLAEIETSDEIRTKCEIPEFDRVMGGGIVCGSINLVGGPPGIGKSTLMLQVAEKFAQKGNVVLYVSGEESLQQIKFRAERLEVESPNLLFLSEISLEAIEGHISRTKPGLVLIDSIQTLYKEDLAPAPGSVTQIRECTARLMRLGKREGIPIILAGHVTKDGSIAGPRVLEHIVDVVLYFEGETYQNFRILRAVKNRFGSTNEIGIFEMEERGLVGVNNASAFFLAQRNLSAPGSAIVPIIEGSRPLMVEIQALVTGTSFGMPARRSNGIDQNRLSLLLAVLEKRGGLMLSASDVFVNVVGGVRVDETAADLGVIMAIASSFMDKPLPQELSVMGEVGLGGEIRGIPRLEERLLESAKMGFTKALIPARSFNEKLRCPPEVRISDAMEIRDAIKECLG